MARTAVIVGTRMAGWEWIAKGQGDGVGRSLPVSACDWPTGGLHLPGKSRRTKLPNPKNPS